MSELFDLLGYALAPAGTRKPPKAAVKASLPYVLPLDDSSGCEWEFDYDYEVDDGEINVNVTAIRLHGNGPEIPVPLVHVSTRWLCDIEDDIAEEVLAELTDAAEASHRDPSDDGDYSYDAMLDKRGPR